MRREFGFRRKTCACATCQRPCRVMPGFLVPSDLERLIPAHVADSEAAILAWAEQNLLASPGAIVVHRGELQRIPTLVPAVKPDGSCIHLDDRGGCRIHADAPFGCAFFDCGPEPRGAANRALVAVHQAHRERSLYAQVWYHLHIRGRVQLGPEVLRKKLKLISLEERKV